MTDNDIALKAIMAAAERNWHGDSCSSCVDAREALATTVQDALAYAGVIKLDSTLIWILQDVPLSSESEAMVRSLRRDVLAAAATLREKLEVR